MKALEIADALEQRIAERQLTPGSPVPSTRAIARRWKVSTVTAAHALRLLKERGKVKAVPRSGTVVAGSLLSTERIVSAAIEVADHEGLEAVSLRGVSAKLGAPVMSLYRHVRNKEELLALMADAVFGEVPLPRASKGWRATLEAAARAEWRLMRRHPWLARLSAMNRPQPMENAIRFTDFVLQALEATTLREADKLELHLVLHGFVQGLAVNLELEEHARSESGVSDEEHVDRQAQAFASLAASGRFPAFTRMSKGLGAFDLDLDRLFERGLTMLLDGLGHRLR